MMASAKKNVEKSFKQETELLRRWSLETRRGIQDKDRKLSEATELSESQKLEILTLKKETDQLLTNVRNLEQEKQEVEDKINLTKEAVRGTSVQVEVLKSHTNSIQRSTDILDQSIKEKKAYLTRMRAKLQEMSEKDSSMLEAGERKCRELEEEKASVVRSLEQDLIYLEKSILEMETRLTELQELLQTKNEDVKKTQTVIQERDEEIDRINAEIREVGESKSLEKEKISAKISLLNIEIGQLKVQKSHLEKSRAHGQEKLEKLKSRIEEIMDKQSVVRQEKMTIELEQEKIKSVQTDLQDKITELENDLETEMKTNSTLNLRMKELSNLKLDLKMKNDDISVSEERNVSLAAEITHLAKVELEIVELNSRILELEAELLRFQDTYQEKLSSLEYQHVGTKQALENTSGCSTEKDEEHRVQVVQLQDQLKDITENTEILNNQLPLRIDELSVAETGLEELKSEHSSLTEMKNQDESDQDAINKELDAALLHYETQMKEMELEVKKWNEALDVEASSLDSENEKVKTISGEIEKIREDLFVCNDELMSSKKKLKEENTRLSGFEEDSRRAGETAASSRSRTEELVSQLENKEQAVNSLKERMIEFNLELEKELAASLPAEEDKMYVNECEKYEKLMVKLECLKLSRTESEKVLQEGSERLQDLEFKIAEVKRSGQEFAQSEMFTEMQESMDKLVEEYQAKVKSIEMLDDDLKKVDIELSNAKSNNHYKTLELENQNAEKKSLIQKIQVQENINSGKSTPVSNKPRHQPRKMISDDEEFIPRRIKVQRTPSVQRTPGLFKKGQTTPRQGSINSRQVPGTPRNPKTLRQTPSTLRPETNTSKQIPVSPRRFLSPPYAGLRFSTENRVGMRKEDERMEVDNPEKNKEPGTLDNVGGDKFTEFKKPLVIPISSRQKKFDNMYSSDEESF